MQKKIGIHWSTYYLQKHFFDWLIDAKTQTGVRIDDELTVKPGTPLNMEIELDRESADIYGLMVSKMEVTDTKAQSEILVLNG